MTDLSQIRNFSIVAHIDHGKSTLADRLLEQCNTVDKREMEDQILDSMDLERERGITIKARAVRLDYRADDGQDYVLNLIDTPGHVDFNYEVSRSLSACEGAVLVVDASQGIEAQTLANTYLAIDNGLEVLPVINKIDLPAARPEEVKHEIEDVIGLPAMDAPEISAKNGINIHAVLEMIVKDVPAPKGDREAPLQCLIFDSQYDSYRGAIVYMRVVNGVVTPGMDIKMMSTGAVYKVVEVGYLHPLGMHPAQALGAGEVGYLTASIKTVSDTRVGDTITGVEKDVVRERLEREYDLSLITTAPSVIYRVYCTDGTMVEVDNPSQMPDMTKVDHIEEPLVKTTIIIPKDMVGTVMEISQSRRGQYVTMDYLDDTRVSLVYNLPLCEILYDYFDVLKSATRGYASLDYELNGYQSSPMVKMDILINGDVVDALSVIVHRDFAARRGRALVEKLRSLIPRQLFQIPVQAAVGNKIIARENVAALRKDVLAKCYGGDISRKRKLLEKQKEGKTVWLPPV